MWSEAIMNEGWCMVHSKQCTICVRDKSNAKWILLDKCSIYTHPHPHRQPYTHTYRHTYIPMALNCFIIFTCKQVNQPSPFSSHFYFIYRCFPLNVEQILKTTAVSASRVAAFAYCYRYRCNCVSFHAHVRLIVYTWLYRTWRVQLMKVDCLLWG